MAPIKCGVYKREDVSSIPRCNGVYLQSQQVQGRQKQGNAMDLLAS